MPKKILVADDEPHIVHVVSLKLRNAGYEVIAAEDGQEALELGLAERPDLVITDYQMPGKTGLEFCRELRAHEEMKNLVAVMLTARGFDLQPAELAEAGIVACLAKPFSPRELLAKVTELLGETERISAAHGRR